MAVENLDLGGFKFQSFPVHNPKYVMEETELPFFESYIDAHTSLLLSALKDEFFLCFKNSHEDDFDLIIAQDINARDVASLFKSHLYYYFCVDEASKIHGNESEEFTRELLRLAYWHYLSATMRLDDPERKWIDILSCTRLLGYLSGIRNAPISEITKLAGHGYKFLKKPLVIRDDYIRQLKADNFGRLTVEAIFNKADKSIIGDLKLSRFRNIT